MRLVNLTTRNFRGFGSASVQIPFDADLVLLFGPNGFGKTSLAEAVEWLFYGTTRRRQRGESFSKDEYEGCFANVHGGTPVEVSAKIRTSTGIEHTITRRIPDPRNDVVSETFIDGNPAALETLGLTALDAVHPVIAQHDLQSFIHSRPKDRRDLISAALGLDELTALKTALDGARKAFAATLPSGVEDARVKLRESASVLATLPETKSTGLRWMKSVPEVKPQEDVKALIAAAHRLTGTAPEGVDATLADLRARRQELSRNVFDHAKLLPPTDIPATVSRLGTESANLNTATATLATGLAQMVAAAAATYAHALLQFWDAGLKLPVQDETCPMCEEATLTEAKRESLRSRLKSAQETLARNKQVTVANGAAQTALTRTKQAIENAGLGPLSVEDRELLTKLLSAKAASLAVFLAAHDDLMAVCRDAHSAADALSDYLSTLTNKLADTAQAPQLIADSTAIPRRVLTATDNLKLSLQRYAGAWTTFEPVLSTEIASNKAIAEIDAVGKALKSEAAINTAAAYETVSKSALTLMQNTEAFLQKKQNELLAIRGTDIKTLYDQLNPGAQVGFEGMEPGTAQLRLHASSFGVRMSAAATLSECQLNCLGLSFCLSRTMSAGSPFGFVLLDDPVQSMDDDHCEAFIGTVVPALCDGHKKQVIILSHEQGLINRIRDLNKTRDPIVYHYDDYERTGPSITEQINLEVMRKEAVSLSKGNEANRALAVEKLRKLGEQFIRELYLSKLDQPVPAQFDAAQPAELLALFRTIPDTIPDEYVKLKDTFDFSSPSHHQQAGYSVPITTNITPHLDRMQTLMKKYKLIR